MGIAFRSQRGDGDEPCYRKDERDWHEWATLAVDATKARHEQEVRRLCEESNLRWLAINGVGWARDATADERAEQEGLYAKLAARGRPQFVGAQLLCVFGRGATIGGSVARLADGTLNTDQFQGGHWPTTGPLLRDAWIAKHGETP